MSRIGNNPITIPEGVSVEISDNKIVVKGKLGEIEQEFSDVLVKMNDGVLNVERTSEVKEDTSKAPKKNEKKEKKPKDNKKSK